MALATQCPHCHTTFRVAHDQLKLRAGLVRCGACKEIFNGVEHLLRSVEPAQSSDPTDSQAETIQASALNDPLPAALQASAENDTRQVEEHGSTESVQPSEQASTSSPAQPVQLRADNDNTHVDPLQRMTLMDFTAFDETGAGRLTRESADESDELTRAIDELQRKPWRGTKRSASDDSYDNEPDTAESAEPDFIKRARRQQRIGRKLRVVIGFGSFILLIGLLVQLTYTFRNQIAAWLPQTKPLLVNACALVGCRVELPTKIDAVSIESSELQALTSNQSTFVLVALLRNRSATAQAWPNIELTLNDATEKTIVRRVFTPRDYLLSTPDLTKGFGVNAEQSVKLFFELSQLKASGYRVYLFYP